MPSRVLWATCGIVMAAAMIASLALVVAPRHPSAAEAAAAQFALIMVDDPACHYCRKFDAEVGPGYPKSREGRIAPLIKIGRGSYELRALELAPATYTPTFILMRGKKEAGRITGYSGAVFFYEELGALLERSGSTFFLTPTPPETSSNRGT